MINTYIDLYVDKIALEKRELYFEKFKKSLKNLEEKYGFLYAAETEIVDLDERATITAEIIVETKKLKKYFELEKILEEKGYEIFFNKEKN